MLANVHNLQILKTLISIYSQDSEGLDQSAQKEQSDLYQHCASCV